MMMGRAVVLSMIVAATLQAQDISPSYRAEIKAWQQNREAGLRSDSGWLTLVGLFWLKPGKNTIGSGDTSDFLLPKHAPPQIGVLELDGTEVTFRNLAGDQVTVDRKPVSSPVVLKHSADDDGDLVQSGSISFFVIERDGKLAVRVKDRDSRALKNFKGTDFFPINPDFRFEARFTPSATKIAVPNILGGTEMQDSPGVVDFNYQGQTYQLRPVIEDKTLFFIFRDLTSKKETYPAGRMLNTPMPENGKVVLDFNRAYNPPCAFTPYATCPLPPKGNTLPLRIEAGELRYNDQHTP
jgi:uncharacterized protein